MSRVSIAGMTFTDSRGKLSQFAFEIVLKKQIVHGKDAECFSTMHRNTSQIITLHNFEYMSLAGFSTFFIKHAKMIIHFFIRISDWFLRISSKNMR